MLVFLICLLLFWIVVAACAWAAVYSARTWRRPDSRHRMRPVSYHPRVPRSGGVF